MSVRNTQVGQEVQLNGLGNSIAGSGQGTTVQLGALSNSNPSYKDPTNPCQYYQQTNYMGSYRNRNLVYLNGYMYGPTIGLTGQYFSVFCPGAYTISPTYIQGAGSAQGYIIGHSSFYGSGGYGGPGGGGLGDYYSPNVQPGSPGGSGSPAIDFQGGAYGILHVEYVDAVYGGGGGGGGGGGLGLYLQDTWTGYGGGGGGGGYMGGPGGGGGGGQNGGYGGQPGNTGTRGAGAAYSGGYQAGPGGYGGGNSASGDPGVPGNYGASGGSGGAAGAGITGFPGYDYIQWVATPHN